MRPKKGSLIIPRREFLAKTSTTIIGLHAAATLAPSGALLAAPTASPRRIGAVAYNFQYNIGLFTYKNRTGPRMDSVQFIEAVHRSGRNVAQLFGGMITSLDAEALKRIRTRAEELDVRLEVQGGTAQQANYIKIMEQSAALGVKMIGCSFGMLLRPDKIATRQAWEAHLQMCEARLRELIPHAQRLGLVIGVEDHLDFTLEELHGLIKKIDSPVVGVLFDVGNWLGTLDDPIAAGELLSAYTVATHYKDFAVEETPSGFRLTMVPLGCGSLDLPGITAALLKNLRPEANLSIEMMNGQQLEVKWLESRFWTAYQNKNAADVAATLNHVRRQTISRSEFQTLAEVDALPHEEHLQFEARQSQRCIEFLKKLAAKI